MDAFEVVEVTVEDVVDGFTEVEVEVEVEVELDFVVVVEAELDFVVDVDVELDFTVVDVDVELGFTVVDDVEVGSALQGLPWPQEKQPVVQFSWNMPMTVFSCTWMLCVTPAAL